ACLHGRAGSGGTVCTGMPPPVPGTPARARRATHWSRDRSSTFDCRPFCSGNVHLPTLTYIADHKRCLFAGFLRAFIPNWPTIDARPAGSIAQSACSTVTVPTEIVI
ncbi:unnamed protein product, partial [Sphacelaria rigidula]